MLALVLSLSAFGDPVEPSSFAVEVRSEPILLDCYRGRDWNLHIREAFVTDLPRARHCYEQALRRDASLSGSLKIRFTVLLDGNVADVRVASSDIDDRPLFNCVSGFVAGIRLPGYRAEAPVVVNQPVRFSLAEVDLSRTGYGSPYMEAQ